MAKVNRALISVYDKTGVVEFARGLADLGIELISTGGTAKKLKEAGITVMTISDLTGYPEMLDGRVKTLHPKIHAALLAQRSKPEHQQQLREHEIELIDLVVVNLYPFEETVAKKGTTLDEAIEQIDIGGVALMRSAAKNFSDVIVVVNPAKYELILEELIRNDRELTSHSRLRLAAEAFKYTSLYDSTIYNYLYQLTQPANVEFPNEITMTFAKSMELRYGENPHQKAAFYREVLTRGLVTGEPRINLTKQLHGKQLSYNNLIDTDGALAVIKEFSEPAVVIVKHTNACGAACDPDIGKAYLKALATDPVSSFGGIVVFNDIIDDAVALELNKLFVEVLLAPGYTEPALKILEQKKNIRILLLPELAEWRKTTAKEWRLEKDIKKVTGGVLIQDRDLLGAVTEQSVKVVTEKQPDAEHWEGLKFSWNVVKHIKSNAIVLAKGKETVAIGAGQMSRVDSVKIAALKAKKPLENIVLASDAFFPFRDAIDESAKMGVRAIIQPGGSVRDEEVIAAANEYGIAMVFTGTRHFKH